MPGGDEKTRWSLDRVKEHLSRTSGADGASAQVFLDEDISGDDLGEAVSTAIANVRQRLGGTGHEVTLGRVNKLAKAVSVKGDPEAIAELMREKQIKSVLPSNIDDVYPKPVSEGP